MTYLLLWGAGTVLLLGTGLIAWSWRATDPHIDEPFDERSGGDFQ
jgi:hypothetical protein